MAPGLREGQLVVGTSIVPIRIGQIVIFDHGGIQKIKRVMSIESTRVFVQGDNTAESTDSRHFGSVNRNSICAVIILPDTLKHI